ncbi:ABC transporter substrate-binding protein [Conexibacter sp. CPCC 206217]|uniref:ABC transporter substrate-binding protein n=1 Tax=Conexibacter sp. CPCC 206217 TaxID=3064574 RepID=UPI0027187708|nr:extracellular solute-binding protein [Conexibacter sp. CPCC 206217]MDO8212650.1 extracellular solute-binding protein [Conexibacter sp. CPCC 206217]
MSRPTISKPGLAAVLAALTLSLSLAACGGGAADVGSAPGADTNASSGDSKAQQVYADLDAKGADGPEAAVAPARDEGEVSWYTTITGADPVGKAFSDRYGIKVNIFRGNAETVLQRALQEGQAGRPGADVVEGSFVTMEALGRERLLGDFRGPSLADLPDNARFDGWAADRLNVLLPAWNTDLIRAGDEPRSWEDLADPRYKGRIQLEIGDSDWFAYVTNYWLREGKSQAEVDRLWQAIAANAVTAKGHSTMVEMLAAGQTAINAMAYSYDIRNTRDEGAPVAYTGADGTTSTPGFARPNGAGLTSEAPHPNAGWLFENWLLSPEGQKALLEAGVTPVRRDVPGDNTLDGVRFVTFDPAEYTQDAAGWDRRYDELLRGVTAVKQDDN